MSKQDAYRFDMEEALPGAPSFPGFSLGEGGPLHRLETACHVTKVFGQVLLVFALTWLPVVAIGFSQEALSGRREPLLHDPSLHVRFFIAAPLLLVADHVFPWICRRALDQVVTQGLVPDEAMPRLETLIGTARRLADAAWPEIVLLVLALALGVAELIGVVPITGRYRHEGLTATLVWYALIAGPVLQFLLWRSLWRWLIWARILLGLSRANLRLVANHPDRCGGISFLRLPSVGYCAILLFVASSLVCAGWGGHYPIEPTLISFKPLLVMFAIIGGAIAFGPLMFFTPRLLRARLDGQLENDILAAREGSEFRRQWIVDKRPDFLRAPDAQTLDGLGGIYRDSVERIRFVVFDRQDVIVLLLATLVPVVPVMLIHVPAESWHDLLALLTASRLP
jgi:hypothetical protein